MKKSRFTDPQIMGVLKQADGGMPVPELCRAHGIRSAMTMTEPIRPPPLPGILGCRAAASISHGSREGHKTRQKSGATATTSEQVVKDIRRATCKNDSAEEKIRIVLDGLRGEYSVAEGMARLARLFE